jgi:predicted ATP-binding protein involved in virulence
MRINELYVKNFRNFEEATFRFHPSFTVVIGNNGMGKSSILKAVQVALGAVTQSIPTLPGRDIFRRQFKRNEVFKKYNINTGSEDSNVEDTEIVCKASVVMPFRPDNAIQWRRVYLKARETSHNANDSSEIIEHGKNIYNFYNSKESAIPVLCNFTAVRTDSDVNFSAKTWDWLSKLERGYYSSLWDKTAFEPVIIWLSLYDAMLKAGREFEGTKTAFINTLKSAFGGYLSDIEFVPSIGFYLTLDFKDGSNIAPKNLEICSDGVQTFFKVVAEIAWRCITLNGHLGLEAVVNSPGIVLIDEIDIMLHPNWQRHVVSDLRKAFPNIQFIATTHSPFIVQSLDSSMLWNLEMITDIPVNEMSIDLVSTKVMGVEDRFAISTEFSTGVHRNVDAYRDERDSIKNASLEAIKELKLELQKLNQNGSNR